MANSKLKQPPCPNPHCGSKAKALQDSRDKRWQVVCTNPECETTGPKAASEEGAWDRWRDMLRVPQRFATTKEAADYLRVSGDFLAQMRNTGRLPFFPLGDGPKSPIRYRYGDLDALMEENRVG